MPEPAESKPESAWCLTGAAGSARDVDEPAQVLLQAGP